MGRGAQFGVAGVKFLYLASVWLHVLAAVVWLGGMLFLVLVLVPALRRPALRGVAAPLIQWTGERFRWLGWLGFGLLLVSGTFNLAYRGVGWSDLWYAHFWGGPFGQALAIKLLLVAVVLLVSAAHDFYLGPRATAVWQTEPGSARAAGLRRQASRIGRLNLLLGLAIVFFATMLVRGWP
jgi:copper resistance protein D